MSTDTPHGRLVEARIKAGHKSAADAARAHGWSFPTYAGHENGSRGYSRVAKTYADAFGVDPTWLLYGGSGTPEPPRPEGAALIMHQMPNGKVRLQINKVVDMAKALRILAELEGGE